MNLAQVTTEAIAEVNRNPFSGEREVAKQLCRLFFKNDDGMPFELTDGQADIFLAILLKRDPRVHVMTYTQYGKSETVGMAVVLRSIVFCEDWTIVAGQQQKSDIIMGKAINHLFDHPALEEQIDPLGVPHIERLRHEKSRERVTWRDGGQIKALTASANNRKKVREAVTGQGARNIVQDEASLIPDDLQAMILRMLGGFPDSFLMKIGNPFYRNHFLRSWQSARYKKIFIDYNQGLKEGRLTRDFVEEMRNEPFFDVLYEVKFPASDEVLSGGYRKLVTDDLLEGAFITEEEFERDYCTLEITNRLGEKIKVPEGRPKHGGDFAGGGNDRSAYVVRWPSVMKIIETNKIADTMQQVPIVRSHLDKYNINAMDSSIDYGGLGQGVGDRLHELEVEVNRVMFGESAPDDQKHKYKNMRAYIYYQLLLWIKKGGKIVKNDAIYELLVVNYKESSEGKFQIQPKDELKKLMKDLGLQVTSPDVPDAMALTFAEPSDMLSAEDFGII